MLSANAKLMRFLSAVGTSSGRMVAVLALLPFGVMGCGAVAFNPTSSTQSQTSPGYINIPPKLDILMFIDDTGSAINAANIIQNQVPVFLNQLESEGWDYHFASNSLTTVRSQIPQVAGSVYDGNHSGWVAPYPGAVQFGPNTIVSSFFRSESPADQGTSIAYSDYRVSGSASTSSGASEPGFITMVDTLKNSINGTGFLRQDSLVVLIVIGNGNDTSGAEMRPNINGQGSPVLTLGNVSDYKSQLQGVVSGSSKSQGVRFYAVVNTGDTCSPITGTRYMQMASLLGGGSYDVCSQSIGSILSSLGTSLSSTKLAYLTDYLLISGAPNVSTMVVTKYPGGNSASPQVIPQSSTNGWTYVGYVNNRNLSEFDPPSGGSPVYLNPSSGYAIQLHGSARLSGNDTASVVFSAAGAQTATTK